MKLQDASKSILTIEEVMAAEGFCLGSPAGVSMHPIPRNRSDVLGMQRRGERL